MQELSEEMIAGSDQAAKAIAAARKNLAVLSGSSRIRLQQQDFRDLPGLPDATIVCNPPYGVRLGTGEDAARIYKVSLVRLHATHANYLCLCIDGKLDF